MNTPETSIIEINSKSRGSNVSGRSWKVQKQPMRTKSKVVKNKKLTSWELKEQKRLEDKQFKDKIKALKNEKEEEKQKRVQALRDRREKKEEEDRYQRMAEKMHAKKVDRMRKREKRNKMLKER